MSPAEVARHKRRAAIFAAVMTVGTMLATGGQWVNLLAIAVLIGLLGAAIAVIGVFMGKKNLTAGGGIIVVASLAYYLREIPFMTL